MWAGTAIVVGTGAAIAGGAINAANTGKEERNQDFLQNPEYPHSQDARDAWWNKLQTWGEDPNYGAISPDWNNIWQQTENRIKKYYQGGPLEPGVKDRLNSSIARRGMSDNPASDFLKARVDAQQAGDLNIADQNMNIAKNQFAESGRKTWLDSVNQFQLQKPTGKWDIYTTDPGAQAKAWGNLISGVGSSVAGAGIGAAGGGGQLSWLQSLLGSKQPQGYDSLGGTMGSSNGNLSMSSWN